MKCRVTKIKAENWNIPDEKKDLLNSMERIRKSLGYQCTINELDRKIIYKISRTESLEVFLLKNKIVSVIIHPKLGRTALQRSGLKDNEMLSVLFNPRTHINSKNKRIIKILKD